MGDVGVELGDAPVHPSTPPDPIGSTDTESSDFSDKVTEVVTVVDDGRNAPGRLIR